MLPRFWLGAALLLSPLLSEAQDHTKVHVAQSAGHDGTEYIWQPPEIGTPRGILLLFHGCQHSATDWFPRSSDCPRCIGLPEERRVVSVARAPPYSYVAVAISSQDREFGRCWRMHDLEPVLVVVEELRRLPGFGALPIFAFGASSGGSFVGSLGPRVPGFRAGTVQIMALHEEQLAHHSYPATEFVVMDKDRRSVKGASHNVAQLQQRGVDARVRVLQEVPLSAGFFHERSQGEIPPQLSALLYQSLQRGGFLTTDGYLAHDPRESRWRQVLSQDVPEVRQGVLSLEADASAVSELLNVAWSMHELCATDIEASLGWFEQHK